MTEYDLFVECIPMIAEIVARCRKLSRSEYEEWKQETMEHCPETVKEFMGKIMIIIDSMVTMSQPERRFLSVGQNKSIL